MLHTLFPSHMKASQILHVISIETDFSMNNTKKIFIQTIPVQRILYMPYLKANYIQPFVDLHPIIEDGLLNLGHICLIIRILRIHPP